MKTRFTTATTIMIATVLFSGNADAQDVVNGKKIFGMFCHSCHYLPKEDKNSFGPSLHNVINRPSADYPSFTYSTAMRNLNVVWTEENLDRFIKRPESMFPGTKMDFAGISNPAYRTDIIAYLKANSQ